MNEPSQRPMTTKEALGAVKTIREALDALPDQERAEMIRFALSLGEGDIKCLKH